MRVLLEEVVLDLPDGVEPDAVGDLDLLERVVEQPVLPVVAPGPGQLVLVEDAEAHRRKANGPPRNDVPAPGGGRAYLCGGPPDGRFGNAASSRGPLESVSVGAMAGVTINLLGGFAATVDGVPVADNGWRLRKARELVKLLALAPGHRVHREQAMEALWPDRDPGAAANNLHQAVHVARRTLGAGSIVVRDEQLRLSDEVEVDVDRFARAAVEARREGSAAALRSARALYAGELLPENRYDDWVAEAP